MNGREVMKLDRILDELGDTEAEALREVLASAAPNTHVAETLTRHGLPLSEAAVRRWRQREHTSG